ncbi:MAG: Ig-like domain-containing protein, partial [Methanomicrobiales archaeon]|nr:Ig-like domain-containing protein [Methanomicrobiales archaeon]
MTFKDHPLLSIFLCIALVITLLPLIGAAAPASATRGYIHGTITAADYSPASIPIRGITVFIARVDGTYSVTLRTNESGMYQSGTIDDRGVGFTVDANKPDIAGYNARYESASYEDILFTATDRDGETRDFALHGSSTSASTPTATPTPSPTPTPTRATPTATPTRDGSGVEATDGYEPDSPASQGYIHGTVRKDNINSGPGVNGLTVFVWRRDGQWSDTYTTYRNGNSDGYFNTGTLSDPSNAGFNVAINKADQDGYKSQYTTSEHTNIHVSSTPAVDNHVIYSRSSPQPSGMVTLKGTVTDTNGNKLGGIPVYFWRQDGQKAFSVTTGSNPSDSATFGMFSTQVEKYTGSCGSGTKCYNVMANKWTDPARNPAWFNSTEQLNVKPDYDKTLSSFRLPTAKVTFSGRVTDETTGKGVNGIEVFLWRHDNGESVYARTQNIGGYDGKWSIQVSRSVSARDPDQRFNVMANKNNPGHYNPAYFNSTERVNLLPFQDQSYLDFRILSGTVKFDGLVKDQKTGLPVSGIEVFLWRHDGKSWKTTTGSDGKWSAMVDRSSSTSNPDHRIN